jgi:hypothetical protein
MNSRETRRHQMFVRAQNFGADHANDFAGNSLGKQYFTALATIINEIDSNAASEASGVGQARQGTTTRSQAIDSLREDLEAINRTARAMTDDAPGIDDMFRMPRSSGVQALLNAARAFAADALPLKTQFIAHELPSDFLEELDVDIAALEAAISRQSSGVGDHVAASAAIDDAIERGTDIVSKLDAIVKNKYANNPAVLAEWLSASHTERATRHLKTLTAGPGSPPSSGGGSPTP